MNAVPFTVEVYAGFGQCEGLLSDDGDAVALEFQIADNIARVLKTDVRQVRIPLKDLASVSLKKGWFGMSWMGVKIVLQAARMDVLKDVPGMVQGQVELSIARKDREAAERFVAGLHQMEE